MKAWLARIGGLLLVAGSFTAAAEEAGPLGAGTVDVRRSAGVGISPSDSAPVRRAPERVLSTALLADELLLETLPLERWVGVSYVVDWPSATPSAGRFPESLVRTLGTTEDILSRRPDLVVFSPYNDALTVAQLQRSGVALHLVPAASTFEELLAAWAALGDRVGQREASESAIERARARLELIRERGRRAMHLPEAERRTLLLQGMFSYGPGSLQHDCLVQAGLVNVLPRQDSAENPALNVEYVLRLAPEIIFVAANVRAPREAAQSELPRGVPWRAVPAVQRRRVVAVPGSWMASISHHALLACEAYATATSSWVGP